MMKDYVQKNKHLNSIVIHTLTMGEKNTSIITSIKSALSESPLSISELSKKAKINWRTAEQYLELLKHLDLVVEANIKNTRTFFLKDKNNYFELPVKKKDSKIISTFYFYIKKFCIELFNKEPTKTQVYKILWKADQRLNLNLPIGWYMYGPMCVQIYQNNEQKETELDKKTINIVHTVTKEYCACDNFELQKKIYEEVGEQLYKIKENLISHLFDHQTNKEEINAILMDFIKFSPLETIDVVTDFARATLLLGWNKMNDCFDKLWHYIGLVKYRDSLFNYYGEQIDIYLKTKIEDDKKEAQIYITDLVRCNRKTK